MGQSLGARRDKGKPVCLKVVRRGDFQDESECGEAGRGHATLGLWAKVRKLGYNLYAVGRRLKLWNRMCLDLTAVPRTALAPWIHKSTA